MIRVRVKVLYTWYIYPTLNRCKSEHFLGVSTAPVRGPYVITWYPIPRVRRRPFPQFLFGEGSNVRVGVVQGLGLEILQGTDFLSTVGATGQYTHQDPEPSTLNPKP